MHYYSFGTALYQRFVGKQIRVVMEILGIGVFRRLQSFGVFLKKKQQKMSKI